MKKISVVIPCFNAEKYLPVCMTHLLQQTMNKEDMEIILVDDASTDGGSTWECILKYEKQAPELVTAIRLSENKRQGGARNAGIGYASGEYLLFCDADDWLAQNALERLYAAAKSYDADVVEFKKKSIRHGAEDDGSVIRGDDSRFFEITSEEERRKNLTRDYQHFPFGFCTKLYRMSLIREKGILFAEHVIFEEPSFTVPVLMYEKRHYYLDETLYFYYRHAGSTMTSGWDDRKWDNAKVWLFLIQDLERRGFLEHYHEELEYIFTCWYLGLSIKLWCQKGYYIQNGELLTLLHAVSELFPNAAENRYFRESESEWDQFVCKILQIEITDESVAVINRLCREKFFRKYYQS